jgi:hypothetical protein
VGVNVTATVQVAEGATGFAVEQVVPEAAMANGPLAAGAALKTRLASPVLVNVIVCALLVVPTISAANVRESGRLTVGAVAVPASVTLWTLPTRPLLLSVMVNVPPRAPATVGTKVTLIVQLALAATLDPQVFVWAKSPLAAMLAMASAPLPVLFRVTVCAAEVDPTA